eukprot:114959_1
MSCLNLDNNFSQRKAKTLQGLQFAESNNAKDKSPKGFIDEPIIPLIACINGTEAFYTTSSCSGRIALFLQRRNIIAQDGEYHSTSQKGGEWLLISHEHIKQDQISNAIETYTHQLHQRQNNTQIEMSLKFEPFILHIECADLLSAKQLLSLSRQIGFRESGINAISNRIMLRITFNLKLEVPLFYGNADLLKGRDAIQLLPNIHNDYLQTLTNIANDKMRENLTKIQTFYQAFQTTFYPSFKWFNAYQSQPDILAKQVSKKMDTLFQNIQSMKQHIANHKSAKKYTNEMSHSHQAQWCLLVHRQYQKDIHDQLIRLNLMDDRRTFDHHSTKYKPNWSYIPISYDLARHIMDAKPATISNKLRYLYDLYDNTLCTHSKLYSFDIDLLLDCVHVIPYRTEWLNILHFMIKDDDHCDEQKDAQASAECIVIGLCFRLLPKQPTHNTQSQLQSIIYSRSKSKAWCSALIAILDVLCDAIESKKDDESVLMCLNTIINDFPTKYEKLGDCVLFPSTFEATLDAIKAILQASTMDAFYGILCKYFKCDQIGMQQAIRIGIKRESGVQILYDPNGKQGVVKHRENRIWYQFNVTQIMFSSGNLTEKIRMGQLAQPTDVVLDLYAGIGYFTLSFLIHAKVQFVYCCEINKNSIQSLKRNMMLNKIDPNRYRILEGDNAKTTVDVINKVDRVNLGLLPSSEAGWIPAIRALKPSGGVMHIHHNVHCDHKQQFLDYMVEKIKQIIQSYDDKKHWNIQILHCEHVKWYAPKISHTVVDVELS